MTLLRQPILLILLLIISIAVGAYGYFRYQETQQDLKGLRENPRVVAIEEIKRLVAELGQVVDLPKGEEPVVATVTDRERLKDQAFFAKAQNGDKVLIYTQAKRAILYRPLTKKIIDVGPVNIGTGSGQTVAGTQTGKVGVAIYNGTKTQGFANAFETRLESELDNIEVVAKENASRDDYKGIIVVDLSGREKALAQSIAKLLGGQVGSLPSGERKPNADILVILGSQPLGSEPKPTEEPTPTILPSPSPTPVL